MLYDYIKVSLFWVDFALFNPKTLNIVQILPFDIMYAEMLIKNVAEMVERDVKDGRVTGLGKFEGKRVKVLLVNDITGDEGK